jgi:hypothetical protein
MKFVNILTEDKMPDFLSTMRNRCFENMKAFLEECDEFKIFNPLFSDSYSNENFLKEFKKDKNEFILALNNGYPEFVELYKQINKDYKRHYYEKYDRIYKFNYSKLVLILITLFEEADFKLIFPNCPWCNSKPIPENEISKGDVKCPICETRHLLLSRIYANEFWGNTYNCCHCKHYGKEYFE